MKLWTGLTVFLIAAVAAAQPPPQFATGRVAPTLGQFAALQGASIAAHADLLANIPDAKEPKWDSRAKGWIPAIKNQGQCGSCWAFSGNGVTETALIKSGELKIDAPLSEQYTLDCYENGGCGGDDNTTVLKHAKKVGLPLTSDYGPYHASAGRCKSDGKKLLKIVDWGFADHDAGYEQIGGVQKIKNAIKEFGIVGCAIAADNAFSNSRPGQVFRGRSRSINHDVALVGWDDTLSAGKTVWILRNSWGTAWCDGGYSLIEEGANSVGTEPVFAVGKKKDPEPEPVPPGPAPDGELRRHLLIFLAGLIAGAIVGVLVTLIVRRK